VERTLSAFDAALRRAGERLVDRYPGFESVLLPARDRYARAQVWLRWRRNRLRYAAPPEPYRLVDVDPGDVRRVDPLPGPKFRYAGRVDGGDWDRDRSRFEEMDVFRAYRRHFEAGVPWEETAFFDRVVAEIESGRVRWGCRSREAFEARCDRLDRLYERIRTEGYMTQAELSASGARDPIRDQPALKTERFKHEIAVNVGRDGEVFFSDGRNRLSIAKLLDLERVPVRVLRRHRGWQAVRDAYVRGDPVPQRVRDHPDLAGLERGGI
jgi:hypothetical protein